MEEKEGIPPSKSEVELNKKLYEENKSDSLINLTDNYSIEEFSYLIKMASVIVTGDTVALHIAISLGTKIVSFFEFKCLIILILY